MQCRGQNRSQKASPRLGLSNPKLNLAATGRIFECIGEEIKRDLLKCIHLSVDRYQLIAAERLAIMGQRKGDVFTEDAERK